ncbi:hypothetical protein ACE38W_13440 [Chitinophaga sp. Hz27]|uniref:hypothetical protein n=1 Tax=Chitinophaga sp. Hz27 TaxID=3347169 RepID=UPI0035DD7541
MIKYLVGACFITLISVCFAVYQGVLIDAALLAFFFITAHILLMLASTVISISTLEGQQIGDGITFYYIVYLLGTSLSSLITFYIMLAKSGVLRHIITGH